MGAMAAGFGRRLRRWRPASCSTKGSCSVRAGSATSTSDNAEGSWVDRERRHATRVPPARPHGRADQGHARPWARQGLHPRTDRGVHRERAREAGVPEGRVRGEGREARRRVRGRARLARNRADAASTLNIREVAPEDVAEWLRMRTSLWPDSDADHATDIERFFEEQLERKRTFVAEDGTGRVVGFLELDQRSYAPGCKSSPVPLHRGVVRRPGTSGGPVSVVRWFVQPRTGPRAAGFTEIGSDVEIDNLGQHSRRMKRSATRRPTASSASAGRCTAPPSSSPSRRLSRSSATCAGGTRRAVPAQSRPT